eukprot:CAMPEP_0201490014 /NCGR_PEP_ID=MMETSP0151_2-20130828/24655_1 /ASSEMBLY_ACC=CAM_ASM_000257 /TAXON_ID=200890 /ORGANISM="Paramoeba atlantica, Strain 621/1 / CCAP 1560/9" /LENGTH=169 /DNA_ID=CAMNT_0047875793 /DNA_START=9 /DNA_END=518 /DNA_ORIENTATION=+
MGCAIGKEESSEKPQERKRVEKEYAPPSGSQSTQIAIPNSNRSGEDPAVLKLGKSVQDQRDAEEDYLKDLLDQTARNFIVVSEDSSRFSEIDEDEKYQSLRAQLQEMDEAEHVPPALPNPDEVPLKQRFAKSNPAELQLMEKYGERLSVAIQQLEVDFKEQIVVPFEPY